MKKLYNLTYTVGNMGSKELSYRGFNITIVTSVIDAEEVCLHWRAQSSYGVFYEEDLSDLLELIDYQLED